MGLCPDVWEGDKAERRPFFTANLPNFQAHGVRLARRRSRRASIDVNLSWIQKTGTAQVARAEGGGGMAGCFYLPFVPGRGLTVWCNPNSARCLCNPVQPCLTPTPGPHPSAPGNTGPYHSPPRRSGSMLGLWGSEEPSLPHSI